MPSALAAIWSNEFTRTYRIWGKEVVLKALQNVEIEHISSLVAQQPEENQAQALGILLVAAATVSIDGLTFTDPESGIPLTLEQRAAEVNAWHDPLTALLKTKVDDLIDDYVAAAEEVSSPPE
jgi:hypothetical protein